MKKIQLAKKHLCSATVIAMLLFLDFYSICNNIFSLSLFFIFFIQRTRSGGDEKTAAAASRMCCPGKSRVFTSESESQHFIVPWGEIAIISAPTVK